MHNLFVVNKFDLIQLSVLPTNIPRPYSNSYPHVPQIALTVTH